jgi:hypothetical protein
MIKKLFILQLFLDIFYVFILIKISIFYVLIFINLILFFKVTYNKLAFWKAKRYLRKINELQQKNLDNFSDEKKIKYSKKISNKVNKLLSKRKWWVVNFGFRDKIGVYWFFTDILNKDRYYNSWKKFQRFKLLFEFIGK